MVYSGKYKTLFIGLIPIAIILRLVGISQAVKDHFYRSKQTSGNLDRQWKDILARYLTKLSADS